MFRIWFVCTGNRCRSPFAARYFADLIRIPGIEVRSAGLLDAQGFASPPETLSAAARFGIDLSDHRSRVLPNFDRARADLVIGFERGHVAAAVVEGSARVDATFVLPELVDLLENVPPPAEADPVERARALVASSHDLRVRTARFVVGEEIADPIGRPQGTHDEVTGEIAALCRRLGRNLFAAHLHD